jgi:hypothetical protein
MKRSSDHALLQRAPRAGRPRATHEDQMAGHAVFADPGQFIDKFFGGLAVIDHFKGALVPRRSWPSPALLAHGGASGERSAI